MLQHAQNQDRPGCDDVNGEGESAERAGHTHNGSGAARGVSDNRCELQFVTRLQQTVQPSVQSPANSQLTDEALLGGDVQGEDEAPTQAVGSPHAYRGFILPVSSLAAERSSAARHPARGVSLTPPSSHAPGGRHLHWLVFALSCVTTVFALYYMDDPRPVVSRLPPLAATLLIGFTIGTMFAPAEVERLRALSTFPPPPPAALPHEYCGATLPASGARRKAAGPTRTTGAPAGAVWWRFWGRA